MSGTRCVAGIKAPRSMSVRMARAKDAQYPDPSTKYLIWGLCGPWLLKSLSEKSS
jgi:hypothetical protein